MSRNDPQVLLLQKIAHQLNEKKGKNILAIDVRGHCQITDYFLFLEGNVAKHLDSLARELIAFAKECDDEILHYDGQGSEWQVVDLGGILVHLMSSRVRELYQLEKLWGVGTRVKLDIHNEEAL